MRLTLLATFAFFAAAYLLCGAVSWADEWPHQTVRIITNFPPGTGGDVAARVFAENLGKRWNKPVIVENRAGADGVIVVSALMNANDGHTLLFANPGPFTSNPLDPEKHLPYDPARDVTAISSAVDVSVAIVTPASLNVRTLADFAALARSRPGQFNWAGTPGALDYIMPHFFRRAGLVLAQVSYRDIAPAMQDLTQGRLHLYVSALATVLPIVQSQSARVLAITNSARTPLAPEAPTASDAGFADLDYNAMLGFFGPRGMPDDLRDRISADVRAVAAEPAIGARFATFGMIVHASTPAAFADAVEGERTRLGDIARSVSAKSSR
jgi:tripartite-type tricarboxylate transporter receptor subunit TctC